MNRRLVLAGLLAAAPLAAHADPRTYRGWTIDESAHALTDPEWTSLKAQIDLVESVKIKPEIKDYWRSQILIIDPTMKQPGRAGPMRLFLSPAPNPPINPVLLHELIHVYHFNKLPQGRNNPTVIRFYEVAKRADYYPPQAYLLSNPAEFLAMNASVVIWGRAARPPFERATVKRNQPDLYAWIVEEFGLSL